MRRRSPPVWWTVVNAVLFAVYLGAAVWRGGRWNWIAAAILALALAVDLWVRGRTPPG